MAFGDLRDSSFSLSSRRRHTRSKRDWSSDVCSSDLHLPSGPASSPPPSAGDHEQARSPAVSPLLLRAGLRHSEEGAFRLEQPVLDGWSPCSLRPLLAGFLLRRPDPLANLFRMSGMVQLKETIQNLHADSWAYRPPRALVGLMVTVLKFEVAPPVGFLHRLVDLDMDLTQPINVLITLARWVMHQVVELRQPKTTPQHDLATFLVEQSTYLKNII